MFVFKCFVYFRSTNAKKNVKALNIHRTSLFHEVNDVIKKTSMFTLAFLLSNTPLYADASLEKLVNLQSAQQKRYGQVIAQKVDYNAPTKIIETNANKFYAKEYFNPGTNLVINPEYVMGKPDNKYSEILPNGELTVIMEKPFSKLMFYAEGRIVSKNESDYSVAALVHMEGEEAWRELVPTAIPGALDIPHDAQTLVNTIKIKNTGSEPIHIDAVIGYSR